MLGSTTFLINTPNLNGSMRAGTQQRHHQII
jgi:hypothetical protein